MASALALALLGGPTVASGAQCVVKSRSATVAVLVCPSALSPRGMRDAGVAACKGIKPCNAWIWNDEAKAPARAPELESDLSKAEVQSARAVWMNDSESLMMLQKVK